MFSFLKLSSSADQLTLNCANSSLEPDVKATRQKIRTRFAEDKQVGFCIYFGPTGISVETEGPGPYHEFPFYLFILLHKRWGPNESKPTRGRG